MQIKKFLQVYPAGLTPAKLEVGGKARRHSQPETFQFAASGVEIPRKIAFPEKLVELMELKSKPNRSAPQSIHGTNSEMRGRVPGLDQRQ